MPKKKELQRLDSSKKVNMGGGISISGNINAGAFNVGNINAQNIAGGNTNVYFVSQDNDSLVKLMASVLDKKNLSDDDKSLLTKLIKNIDEQIDLGDKADEGKLNFLLHSIRRISPSVFEILVKNILSQENISPQIRRLVKGGM